MTLTRRTLIGSTLAASGALAAGALAPFVLRRRGPPEVVLFIVADALRADRIGRVVNSIEVTPTLNHFAQDSLHFTRAFSAAPYTKTSVASLLTGRYPPYHGLEYHCFTLPPIPTVQSLFSDRGYFTFAAPTNPWLLREKPSVTPGSDANPPYGFAHRFDLYSDNLIRSSFGSRYSDAALYYTPASRVVSHVTNVLETHLASSSAPFFAYLHFMDTHQPWLTRSPTPFTGRFHPSDVSRSLSTADLHLLDWEVINRVLIEKSPPSPSDKAVITAVYDEAAALFDSQIAALFRWLGTRGLLERATVIVTADHGDELYEHGSLGHGKNLYNTSLAVPLIISRPDLAPAAVSSPVSNVSILPTLYDWFRAPWPPCPVPSLMSPSAAPLYASFNGKRKLILPSGLTVMERHDGEPLFFDIENDPAEMNPLPPDPSLAAELERLDSYSRSLAAADSVPRPLTTYPWQMLHDEKLIESGRINITDTGSLTPAQADTLRALGYLN